MKQYAFLLLITLSATFSNAQSDKSSLIIGKWFNYDKIEITEITFTENQYVGNVVWMKQPNDKNDYPKLDTKNPNRELRNKPILGSQNIFGLQYKNGKWQNGTMYSHKRGGAIKFKVVLITKTELIIKISKGFFSKEITYTRTK